MRLCTEALSAKAPVRECIFSRSKLDTEPIANLFTCAREIGVPILLAEEKDFRSIADTENPQSVACVIEKVSNQSDGMLAQPQSLLLGLDAIADPGNLGTIIRTADWFGANGILLGKSSVDLYNPKVVRATMGSIFHLRIAEGIVFEKLIPNLKKQGYRIIATVSESGIPINELKPQDPSLVLVGSEAQGLAPALVRLADVKMSIPRLGGGESLNAAMAAGIILFHLTT